MWRELRTTLAIIAIALIIVVPLNFAESAQPETSYLALVFHIVPTPTPIPPDISTLVIQRSELRAGFTTSEYRGVSNIEAVATYHDPKAAAAAFVAQGRETSWYGEYIAPVYASDDAIGVASQVYRYATAEGAAQGMLYTVAEVELDNPDFKPITVTVPCCATIARRRTFVLNNKTTDQFLIITQVGRYVTETQSIGVIGIFPISRAMYYAQMGLDHLLTTPQDDNSVHPLDVLYTEQL